MQLSYVACRCALVFSLDYGMPTVTTMTLESTFLQRKSATNELIDRKNSILAPSLVILLFTTLGSTAFMYHLGSFTLQTYPRVLRGNGAASRYVCLVVANLPVARVRECAPNG